MLVIGGEDDELGGLDWVWLGGFGLGVKNLIW